MESVFTVLLIFGIPAAMVVLIVWITSNNKRDRLRLKADLYAKALEKGEKIPEDLLEPTYMKPLKEALEVRDSELDNVKENSLNVGLILMGAGVGISVFIGVLSILLGQIERVVEHDIHLYFRAATALGILPFLMGVAFVIIHFINKNKDL